MITVIYNSENFYLVEYPEERAYELVDKQSARGTLFQGDVAAKFMESMRTAVAEDASFENVDEFLGGFDVLMNVPVAVH
jgi:hypothetical protein